MTIRIIYGAAFFVLLVALALFSTFLGDVDFPLIIHFDKYSGINLWGERFDVLGIIIFGFIVNIINIGFALLLSRKQLRDPRQESNADTPAKGPYRRIPSGRSMTYFLGFFNIVLSVLILIAVGVIISVN